MNKVFLLAGAVVAVIGMISCNTQSTEEHATRKLETQAYRIVKSIQAGNFDEVSDLLHYPPAYTQKERLVDQAAVAEVLGFLTNEFGQLQEVILTKSLSE
ncbi:MAG: hypothetical protein ACRERD_24060 [Candidatus Binatia bacterium]